MVASRAAPVLLCVYDRFTFFPRGIAMSSMNSESRLHTVGDVIDAHARRLISSNEAWKLISLLLLDEIAPAEAVSDLSEQAELIADLRDGECHRPERAAHDAALAARLDDLRQYLARNY
jgi:hypothetical protein